MDLLNNLHSKLIKNTAISTCKNNFVNKANKRPIMVFLCEFNRFYKKKLYFQIEFCRTLNKMTKVFCNMLPAY